MQGYPVDARQFACRKPTAMDCVLASTIAREVSVGSALVGLMTCVPPGPIENWIVSGVP